MCETGEVAASGTGVSANVYVVHGSLMMVAWLALSPIASATARYAQHGRRSAWFKIHLSLQVRAGVRACVRKKACRASLGAVLLP